MFTFTTRAPKRTSLLAATVIGTIGLSACGGESAPIAQPAEAPAAAEPATTSPPVTEAPTTEAPAEAPTTEAPAEAPRDAAVKISQTELGDVLSDPDGKTLYAFTNDVEAKSTCYGTCADAWPPVIVDPSFIVSPGLDSGIFATTVRDDGSHQLVAGRFPLYLFAADAKPGDITGQGSGDVWFAVDTSGRLIETIPDGGAAAEDVEVASTISLGDSDLGPVLTDADGLTLYLFTPDEAGAPTCTGDCADAWPPLLVEDGAELLAGDGIEGELSTVEHPDGGTQLKIGKWPLYRFAGDAAPGDVNGQGSGDKWFVVGADGTSIK